jgi:cytochrome c556
MRSSFNRARRLAAAAGVAAAILLPVAHADDKDVIDYREHIMNGLNEQSAILGQIVSGAIPNDQVAAHLDSLALIASTALKSFEAKAPGGEAKPEVWSDWPDFSKRMTEFAQKTAQAAKIAHTEGPDAALTNMLDVLTCKSCHEKYRAEKKK